MMGNRGQPCITLTIKGKKRQLPFGEGRGYEVLLLKILDNLEHIKDCDARKGAE